MSRLLVALAGALAAAVLLPPAVAAATVRSGVDRSAGMRLTLDGDELTVGLRHRDVAFTHEPTAAEQNVEGRLRGICGTTFRDSARPDRRTYVLATARWAPGADRVRFRFRRDLSADVRWCLLEGADGGDVAFVSFVRAEPGRRLASGRGPGGRLWRLAVWRGSRMQPCARLRVGRDGYLGRCFDDQAEREARLDVEYAGGDCDGDSHVFGVVPRAAADVEVALADGTRVTTQTLQPAATSSLQAAWFIVVLPRTAALSSVTALDAAGRPLGVARDDVVLRCR